MQPLTVTSIKDFSLSADGMQATFTLVTKYAGDIAVTLPAECLKVFQSAAVNPEAIAPEVPATSAQSPATSHTPLAQATSPALAIGGTASPPAPAKLNGNGSPAPVKAGEMQVLVPKKWGVGAEVEKHGVVLVFIDPGAPNQSGFALEPKAAKAMAQALVLKADAVAARKAEATPGQR